LEVETVTLGRHIDRLEAAGWVERRADPSDRRAWLIYLSDTAGPTLDEMAALAVETQDEALRDLSAADQSRLIDLLTTIKDAMLDREAETADAKAPEPANG
jgi:DNA-binding MarR family transcriptional regulator